MKSHKPFYKSKTIIFAILVAIFGALEANLPLFQQIMDPKYYGISMTVVAVVVAVLRVFTDTGIMKTPSISDSDDQ